MKIRRYSRKVALKLLFESHQRCISVNELVNIRVNNNIKMKFEIYTLRIICGVNKFKNKLDKVLNDYSINWNINRMPSIDLIILRIGSWELLINFDIPDKVAISEAVNLADLFSTDKSPHFINGLLSKLEEEKSKIII